MINEIANAIRGSPLLQESWKEVQKEALRYCRAGDCYWLKKIEGQSSSLPDIENFKGVWGKFIESFRNKDSVESIPSEVATELQRRTSESMALKIVAELKRSVWWGAQTRG